MKKLKCKYLPSFVLWTQLFRTKHQGASFESVLISRNLIFSSFFKTQNTNSFAISGSTFKDCANKNIPGVVMSGFNDNRCFISFYSVENFIAEIDTYQDHQIYRKLRSDHSLKAKGNCCWVLFSKPNFRGRMTFIGQNERRKRLKRGLGRRHGKRFRSMKKIENCEDSVKLKTLHQRKRQNRYRIN